MLKQKSSEYRGYRNPGIRLSEEMLPQLKQLYGAHTHEMLPQLKQLYGAHTHEMLPAVHAFDKAHTVMLVEEGLLDAAAGAAVLRALRKMESDDIIKIRSQVGGGLHSGEHYVIRLLGEEIGGQFHLARSSGDLSSVAI